MTTPFTPGPWLSRKMTMTKENWLGLWDKVFYIVQRKQDVVAVVWDPNEKEGEQLANTNLLATAPMLFKCLELSNETLKAVAGAVTGEARENLDKLIAINEQAISTALGGK